MPTTIAVLTSGGAGTITVSCDRIEKLTPYEAKQVWLFQRFLRGERTHEIIAWALGEPMSSANDPATLGMGC